MRALSWGWLLAVFAAAGPVAAQSWPAKPVRLVVPYPAGGPVDSVGRLVAQPLGAALGQNVIVENRSGAGGSVGAEVVARAAPDGYTLLLGNTGPMTVNPVLRKGLGYDPRKDFAPVTWLVSAQMVLVVHPSLPVRSLKELVALARSRPGELNYASAGVGNLTHLGMELLQSVAGVRLHHVPYKGAAPAFAELLAGEVAVLMGNVAGAIPHIRAGRVRPIAVSSARRSPVLPEVPPVAELYPGFDLVTWMGVFAPAGTPEAVRELLHGSLVQVLGRAELRERLAGLGTEVVAADGRELAALVSRELALYEKIVRSAGIQPQ
jgi:tripartite-type tricarboxylate transporter receptor subunit TctC